MKKHILIVLFFLAVFGAKAQTPYENYANDGISLDFSKIDDIRFRIYFMYNLQHDGQFSIVQDENDGMYLIFPANNDTDLSDAFDAYYNAKFADFSLLSKTDIDNHMTEWKSGIASADMTSIMMDWFLRQSRVDNETCASSLPFCTSDVITFQAANTSSTAHEPGMDDGCIGSSYNPSFYHMKIRVGGQFIIHMEGHDPNYGTPRDIDFCMWGPYTEAEVMDHSACSNLSSGKIIDCCYSAQDTEDCYLGYEGGIHNHHNGSSHGTINYHLPEVEEYYILMITNFSQQPCVISFSKTPGSGPGETDCGILPGIVTNDGPYCDGETIQLDVNEQPNGTYRWEGPDGWTSTLPHPIRENATVAMSGIYSCTTTVGTETTTASTEVIVDPMPEPTASAQPSSILYGSTTQLNADPGVQGEFSYHWEPEDMVTDPDAQNPQTIALTSTQLFTVTVTSIHSGCTGTAEVSVPVGSGLTVTASADEYVLCEGNSTTLHAHPFNGTGNYTFSWEPAEMLDNASSQNPIAAPSVGSTTFTCQVSDGLATQNVNVTILVNPNAEPTHIYDSICSSETYYFYGEPINTTTYKEHMDHTQFGCDSLVCLHLTVNPDAEPTHIYDSICPGETYYFYGEPITTTSYKEHLDHTHFGCDSLVCLHLTRNPTYDSIIIIDTCDFYKWESNGKKIISYNYAEEIEDDFIIHDGLYQRTYESIYRCDSIVTIDAKFEYTPHPSDSIMSPDPNIGVAPHAVITASEFQINTYDFTIKEQGPSHHWDSVTWILKDQYGNDVDWTIEKEGNGALMHLTVFRHVPGRLYLTATAINECGSTSVTHWLECTFYGIEEGTENLGNVDIVPNPNNGQMTLNFERLTGNVNVKVYNMSGELIDSFETRNGMGNSTMTYNMKQRSDGIYYFVFTGKEGTITKKVVVTR